MASKLSTNCRWTPHGRIAWWPILPSSSGDCKWSCFDDVDIARPLGNVTIYMFRFHLLKRRIQKKKQYLILPQLEVRPHGHAFLPKVKYICRIMMRSWQWPENYEKMIFLEKAIRHQGRKTRTIIENRFGFKRCLTSSRRASSSHSGVSFCVFPSLTFWFCGWGALRAPVPSLQFHWQPSEPGQLRVSFGSRGLGPRTQGLVQGMPWEDGGFRRSASTIDELIHGPSSDLQWWIRSPKALWPTNTDTMVRSACSPWISFNPAGPGG